MLYRHWRLVGITGISILLLLASFLADNNTSTAINSEQVAQLEHRLDALQTKCEFAISQLNDQNLILDKWWPADLQQKGISCYIFKDQELSYWSNNLPINTKQLLAISDQTSSYLNLGNGWYRANTYQKNGFRIICLTLIQSEYYYQNAFLSTRYNPYLKLASNTLISALGTDVGMQVKVKKTNNDKIREPLFVISSEVGNELHSHSSIVLRWLSLIAILVLLTMLFANSQLYESHLWYLLGAFIVFSSFRLFLYTKADDLKESLTLFSPKLYAESAILSSLGELTLHILFVLHFLIIVFQSRIYWKKLLAPTFLRQSIAYAITILVSAFAVSLHYLLYSLVLNSDINFEIYLLQNINIYTIYAYCTISLLIVALVSLLWIQNYFAIHKYAMLGLQLAALLLFYIYIIGFELTSSYLMFILLTITVVGCQIIWFNKDFGFRKYVLTVLGAALYLSIVLECHINTKNSYEREALAASLFTERDPVAEILLRDIDQKIKHSQYWQDRITQQSKPEELFLRLREEYFKGYFQRFDIQFQLCSKNDLLDVYADTQVPCLTFYETKVNDNGVSLYPKSNFYFMNTPSGRITYQGIFHFPLGGQVLFIELLSKLDVKTIGYPELLLDKHENNQNKTFSYAKYLDKKLILYNGQFDYNFELNEEQLHQTSYRQNAYKHYVFNDEKAYTIVISNPEKGFLDIASMFSYTFVLLFFTMWIYLFMLTPQQSYFDKRLSYQLRITAVILAGIIISLTSVTLVILFFTVQQSVDRNISSIQYKMQALIVELDKQLFNDDLQSIYKHPQLDANLLNLSNAHNTDLNLYDLKGNLIASSKRELFDHKLQGELINRAAYSAIMMNKSARFIHQEQIGSLKFYSAYSIYYNRHGKPLVIINLPYFAENTLFENELQQLIATIINIYIFLIFGGIIIAIFVSKQITRPLDLVRQKMIKLNLTTTPEPIDYKEDNELGDLVSAYNRMIAELATSAQQLADTEREIAWREMAKQIAHEIKNPLTPMKLGLQHALMMKQQNKEGWPIKMEQIAKTVLQQIDILAKTASEFSDFARVKVNKLESINLDEIIQDCVLLFDNFPISIRVQSNHDVKLVWGQKQALQRVFTNLLKNATQALTDLATDGIIDIELMESNNYYHISVIDNGPGVSADIESRLFMPNFTSKSGGSGLGLAISKQIVNEMKGQLLYIKTSEGACFKLILPCFYPANNIPTQY